MKFCKDCLHFKTRIINSVDTIIFNCSKKVLNHIQRSPYKYARIFYCEFKRQRNELYINHRDFEKRGITAPSLLKIPACNLFSDMDQEVYTKTDYLIREGRGRGKES